MGKIRANHRPEWSIEKLLMFISEFICKKISPKSYSSYVANWHFCFKRNVILLFVRVINITCYFSNILSHEKLSCTISVEIDRLLIENKLENIQKIIIGYNNIDLCIIDIIYGFLIHSYRIIILDNLVRIKLTDLNIFLG